MIDTQGIFKFVFTFVFQVNIKRQNTFKIHKTKHTVNYYTIICLSMTFYEFKGYLYLQCCNTDNFTR